MTKKEEKWIFWGIFFSLILALILLEILLHNQRKRSEVSNTSQDSSILLRDICTRSTCDSAFELVYELKIAHPEIVKRQIALESYWCNSSIYKSNKNCTGMRLAAIRPTTAIGSNNNHAVYFSLRESVLDYLLWQLWTNGYNMSDEEYLLHLKAAGYAVDSNYISKLR